MSVTFVIGRAGSGKTHYCIERVAALLASADGDRAILLVPEQASFQMERALAQCTAAGGFWRAEVLSFTRLARRVAAELGVAVEPISADARRFGLRLVLARVEPRLKLLRSVVSKPGFLAEMAELIEEWLSERIAPDELENAAESMSDAQRAARLREMVLIYREYCSWIRSGAPDPAQRLDLLREQLPKLAWLRQAHIFVDGFAGFTGQEFATLAALARCAPSLTITLLMDPCERVLHDSSATVDPLRLFSRVSETYGRLTRVFREAGVEIRAPIALSNPLSANPALDSAFAAREAALAAVWDRPGASPIPIAKPITDVLIVSCATPRDELRMVASEIRRVVADSGGSVRFRDCAVITRELQPMAELCREVFVEHEIPHFLDQRRTLRSHPLTTFVIQLWNAVRSDFATDPMLALVRTGLAPIDAHSAALLQTIASTHRLRGREDWSSPWPETPSAPRGGEPLRMVRQRLIDGLQRLQTANAGPMVSGRAWAELFFEALDVLGVAAQLTMWINDAARDGDREKAETHRLAWAALVAALDQLHAFLGDAPLSGDEAASLLAQSMRDATIGLTPPGLDQVLVSAIERSRHPEISHAWLIGFNEGTFPPRPPSPALLTAADRGALRRAGLKSIRVPEDDAFSERLLAYVAMTRAQHRLSISYSRIGMDGDDRLPSPFLTDVLRAFAITETQDDVSKSPPACTAELARRLLTDRPEPRVAALAARMRSNREYAERLNYMLRGRCYANRPVPLGACLPRWLDASVFKCSVSEIETYLQCPFRYFAKYALCLNPHHGPRPIAWELGDAAHTVLAEVVRRAIELGDVSAIADEQWLALLKQSVAAARARIGPDLDKRRPQAAFLHELLFDRLSDVVLAHAERWRRGEFKPLAVEVTLDQAVALISAHGAQPYYVALECDKRLRVTGRIDRIDQCAARDLTGLAIYDYKQRAARLASMPLVPPALQAFVYAAVLRSAGGAVAGVLTAPLVSDAATARKSRVESADAATQRMLMYRPKGLIDAAWLPQFDRGLGPGDESASVAVTLTKHGTPYTGRSDAVEGSAITARCGAATDSAAQAGNGIAGGSIDISPLVVARRLACVECDYKSVCRFERGVNAIRDARHVLPVIAGEVDEEGTDEAGA
ncbi:MAG: PD-(D/E)XK nuclease family protein [Phycisphaerales bacterium]|nr:PD-(D/E)XK nuclease family protein [Phycisphaerales bacterium]